MKWGRIEACFSNKKSARRRHPAGLTAGDAASWSPPPPTRYTTVTLQVFERRAIYPSRSISDAIQHLSFGSSPFWKGVLWAYKAAQVGIRWKIGDDKTVKFWEDWWFGNCSLATQFWYLYIIADQKNIYVTDVWNGSELQISFRRGVTENGMQNWHILTSIAEIHQLYRGL